MRHELTIGLSGLGQRADVAVLDVVRAALGRQDIPRQMVIAGLRAGTITVGGRQVKPSAIVTPGDTVAFDDAIFAVATGIVPNPALPLQVIYEDAQVIVVNKPAGMQVHPTVLGAGTTLVHALLGRYPELAGVGEDTPEGRLRPGIVHRLDRDTSGVMVVARTQAAWEELKAAFHDRTVRKSYRAVVWGAMVLGQTGVIDYPIARTEAGDRWVALRTPRDRHAGTVRQACTDYRVVSTDGRRSVVDLWPRTGRTHQIRVHLQATGHPLVGDALYGRRDYPNNPAREPHHLLCAYRLAFACGGRRYDIAVPLPAALA